MHYADQPAAARAAAQQRTLGLAWLTLLCFFALFLGLLGWAALAVRGVYQTATRAEGGTLIVRGPTEWVAWRPANRALYQAAADGQPLVEGDAVRAVTGAGYGQVASIRLFEQSQLDLWSGAEVVLETLRTSRWHSRSLEVGARQLAGYVRYDLKTGQPFEQVGFSVAVGDAVVRLAPGGSYSVDMREPDRRVARADGGNSLEADVAVRSGSAVVVGANGVSIELRERERVLIDASGAPGLAVPARWDLVRDGGFRQFSELEYNNTTSNDPTLPQSEYWKVYSGPDLPPESLGFFRLADTCRPPIVDSLCDPADRRTAAWFYRTGGQTSSFLVGIQQELGPGGAGIDISEYRSLELTFWARVLRQSLNDAGDRGSECPVMLRLVAKRDSPDSPEEERVLCVYMDADGNPPAINEPGMKYEQVGDAEWEQIRIDLRDPEWLPDYRYLRRIQIFAQGHDYDSRVAEVSLVGEQ
ncbi:MAG TPA: hypothetical protein PKD53_30685 [Chloroflexaceae bacterium]|nr:hypothetical protein [Chloroflexaceae bacterium]